MKSTKLSPHTEPTVFAFLEAASVLHHRFDRTLSVRGISFSEYRLLRKLSIDASTGSPRIELAEAVGLTPSAVTRALKPLEKLGYVTSQRNERDARQSLALLTPAGLRLLQEVQTVLEEVLAALPLNTLSQKQIVEFRARLSELQQ